MLMEGLRGGARDLSLKRKEASLEMPPSIKKDLFRPRRGYSMSSLMWQGSWRRQGPGGDPEKGYQEKVIGRQNSRMTRGMLAGLIKERSQNAYEDKDFRTAEAVRRGGVYGEDHSRASTRIIR